MKTKQNNCIVMLRAVLFSSIAFVSTTNKAMAQDIHFSQFDETPLQLNPANAGVQHETRFILNFKNQWQAVGSPYRTYAFSGDFRMLKKKKHQMGLGIDFFSDKSGDAAFGSNQVNLSLTGIINLNDKSLLSGGLMGGFAQRSLNPAKLQWGSQYDGMQFNENIASGEVSTNNFSFFDLGAGLNYSYGTDEGYISANNARKVNLGVAVFHPHRPAYSFYGDKTQRLHTKFVLSGNAAIGMPNSNLVLKPSYIVFIQGGVKEITPGMTFQYILQEGSKYTGLKKSSAFSLGAYYRMRDAFIGIVRFEYSNYSIGFSYDVNLSKLRAVTSTRGGFEISLRWVYPNAFGNKHFKSRI